MRHVLLEVAMNWLRPTKKKFQVLVFVLSRNNALCERLQDACTLSVKFLFLFV